MTGDSHNNAAFYCPVHQLRFHTAVREVIECDGSPHALGAGFPAQSSWTYCCDCATFSPYEPLTRNDKLRECLVCERQITKRYLCGNCQVMSVESDALVRRKSHSIPKTVVQPNCPGCSSSPAAAAVEHKCEEIGTTFWTSRATCLFCDLPVNPQAPATSVLKQTFCGGCGTELTPPFKFCKRCGKSVTRLEDVVAPVIAETDVNDEELAEIDDTDAGFTDTAELPASDLEFEAESDDSVELVESEPKQTTASWNFSAAQAPPRRRTAWIAGAVVALVSLGILVTVVSIGGNREPRPTPASNPSTTTSRPTYPGMVYLAGGEFTMGSDTGDEYERPAHKVRLSSFYMDVSEVTCEDYLKFVTAKPRRLPLNWTNGRYPIGAAKQPVTGVDWYDAAAYAEWAGKRLPTEEEWEFAARGPSGGKYPWGNEWKTNAANAGDSSAHRLREVGAYPEGKTATGLLDLIGNAWEWTASDMVAYPGGHFSSAVPKAVKIIRGGSWQENNQQATATYRGFLEMSGAEDYSATGFRCVKDAEPLPASSTSK